MASASRRRPRAYEVVVTTDSGERLRFVGRLAEVVAAFAVTLAAEHQARPDLDHLDQWRMEVNVLPTKVIPRLDVSLAPIRFRNVDQSA